MPGEGCGAAVEELDRLAPGVGAKTGGCGCPGTGGPLRAATGAGARIGGRAERGRGACAVDGGSLVSTGAGAGAGIAIWSGSCRGASIGAVYDGATGGCACNCPGAAADGCCSKTGAWNGAPGCKEPAGAWLGEAVGGEASLISKPLTMALSLSAMNRNVRVPAGSAVSVKLVSYAMSFPPA